MSRGRRRVRRGGAVGLLLAACSREPSAVALATIEDPVAFWQDGGFTRLEPAIRYPSPSATQQQVEVWMLLAPGATVTATADDDGIPRLRFGTGTRADRIEYTGEGEHRRIVDVRGTWIDQHGACTHHVLRPAGEHPGGALTGLQWPCDDIVAEREATTQLRRLVASIPPLSRLADEPRMHALDRLSEQNRCDGCHAESRADATRTHEHAVFRGTDANGFFVPQSLLRDALPLEGYGAFDRNVFDPAVTVDCGGPEPVARDPRGDVPRWRCPDDRVPLARFDWTLARQDDPARVEEVCRVRRWLWEHLDEAARAAFPDALVHC